MPNEIKDVAETHLFQQYFSYIEPMCYSDLLLNLIKSIRARWNSTNSTISSKSGNVITVGHHSSNYNENDASNEYNSLSSNISASRQPINIQFRR